MLYISQQIKDQIITLCHESDFGNTYGYLLGFEKRDIRFIEEVLLVNKSVLYKNMSPKFLLADRHKIDFEASEKGLILLGTFVITQSGTIQSAEDQRMMLQDSFSFVTVHSLNRIPFKISSWRLDTHKSILKERVITDNNSIDHRALIKY